MEDYTPTKICSKCKQEFPATTEYFHVDNRRKTGLTPWCKLCQREYYLANRDKKIEHQREYSRANKNRIREYKREYQQTNQAKWREYHRVYRQVNLDKLRENNRQYYQENRDKINEKRRANPEKGRILQSRRRARKANLPDTFTVEQWQACLEYHHYCCAVCGKQLRDLLGFIEPHADHWLPLALDECPGTTVDNIVCLCSECNTNKGAKHPEQWLIEKFGKRRALQILERVHAYFEWTQSRE